MCAWILLCIHASINIEHYDKIPNRDVKAGTIKLMFYFSL